MRTSRGGQFCRGLMSDGDCCRGPPRRVLVGLDPSVQIDDDRVAVAPDQVPVEVPGRPAGRVDAVGLVPGIVLRALEAMVLRQPLHGVVLVRARKREHIR